MARNDQSDAGRKGAPSNTKAKSGYQLKIASAQGEWSAAYSGGAGTVDNEGEIGDQVGCKESY